MTNKIGWLAYALYGLAEEAAIALIEGRK